MVSGLVLRLGSSFSPGITSNLPVPQLGVVSQDAGVGLQHVVEDVEAVGAANLGALAERRAVWVVDVSVGAHEGQQLQLEGTGLLWLPLRVGGLVQRLPAGLQDFVEGRETGVFLLADGAELLQGTGAQQGPQFRPLSSGRRKMERSMNCTIITLSGFFT